MPQQPKLLLCWPFLLCLSIVSSLFSAVVSEIHLGSKLSVAENGNWVSSKGSYAIGFFNRLDEPYQHGLGIHFSLDSIPVDKQTVVWVAGADTAVGNMSYFQLTQNGDLVLFDSSKGVVAWSSKTSQLSVASATLRDDGNLVLLDKTKQIVWQSFDTPSDTLLPGQKFVVHQTLRAASMNSVSSYYSLYLNASGELQLRWESDIVYWSSDSPIQENQNLRAVLTSDGALQLQDKSLNPVWSVFGEDHNDSVDFRFLRLDVDGNLRLYSWEEDSRSWRPVWQAVENQCNVFATCGQHGICVFTALGSTECQCPFKLSSDPNSKCLGISSVQGCRSGSNMFNYEHTFLYGLYPPNDLVTKTTLEQCKQSCLNDTLCTAVTFMTDGTGQCRMKRTRYISGYSYPSVSSLSLVKRCNDPIAVDPHPSKSVPTPSQLTQSTSGFCIPCLLGAASGTFVVLLLIQFGIFIYVYKTRKLIGRKSGSCYRDPNYKSTVMLSASEVIDITGNFKHKIGKKMYKGTLPPNNEAVAVKDLEATIDERKFKCTVSKISNIHHKNLVKLEGYCCEVGHRYLVYEYAKNGSIKNCMEDTKLSKSLTWRKRRDICVSVAKAVCYLHSGCREFVSHGNLKCENVVLDESFEAKVSEFGLGRLEGNADHNDSAELDVEAFGRMVLALVTGCEEVEDAFERAYEEWRDGQAEKVVDERIDGGVDVDELERVLRISFWCIQRDGRLRPSMGEVVKVIEGMLTVDPPPPPWCSQRLLAEEASMELSSEQEGAAGEE